MTTKTINYRITSLLSLWLLVFILSPYAYAERGLNPDQIKGTTKISAEELIALVETKPDLIIIDARISKDRTYGYIEGSISLPNTETDCDSLSRVVNNFNLPTVYYCNGPKCGRSMEAVQIALKCGYTNIYWYQGGFEDWQEKNYPFLILDN